MNEKNKSAAIDEYWYPTGKKLRSLTLKNSISIDTGNIFNRNFTINPADIHRTKMLKILLDCDKDEYSWTDSAVAGKCIGNLFSPYGGTNIDEQR